MPDNTYNDYGTPLTRAEAYLAQIAQNTGGDGSAEGIGNTYNDYGTPLTRAEALLATIMENTAGGGGGGSTGGGVLVVHMDDNTGALDKTWQEIHDADFAVVVVANEYNTETYIVVATVTTASSHRVEIASFTSDEPVYIMTATTDSASGYPVVSFD